MYCTKCRRRCGNKGFRAVSIEPARMKKKEPSEHFDEYIVDDLIGKRKINHLNKKTLSDYEMDIIFNSEGWE